MSNINPEEIISVLKSEIEDYDVKTEIQETGTVVSVGDGIANVYGINHAMYGEIVEFENGVRGLVQNIEMKTIGVVLLGSDRELTEGSKVVRTGKKAGIGVSDAMLGRVVDRENYLAAIDRLVNLLLLLIQFLIRKVKM